MLRPLYLAIIELKRFLSDRGDLAFSIALPVALFALMYGAFGGDQRLNVTAHVVDLDNGPAAEELLSRLVAIDGVTVERHTEAEADKALDRSNILSVVIIPSGFSSGLAAGQPVQITLRQRGSGGDEGQVVSSIVQGIAREIASEYEVRHAVQSAVGDTTLTAEQVEAVIARVAADAEQNPPVRVTMRETAEQTDFVFLLMPGILTMFLLFSVTLAAQSIVTERRNGTLERLLTTRLGVNQMFLGKFFGGVARAMLQAAVLLTLAFVVLRLGNVLTLVQMLLFAFLVAAAVSAVGLVLASIARNRDQGSWLAVVFTMSMTIFGGTFFQPAAGSFMDTAGRFTVNRYANDGFRAIITDGAMDPILTGGLVLAGIAIGALLVARLAFRATEGGR